jgi:hypothetical protein
VVFSTHQLLLLLLLVLMMMMVNLWGLLLQT